MGTMLVLRTAKIRIIFYSAIVFRLFCMNACENALSESLQTGHACDQISVSLVEFVTYFAGKSSRNMLEAAFCICSLQAVFLSF